MNCAKRLIAKFLWTGSLHASVFGQTEAEKLRPIGTEKTGDIAATRRPAKCVHKTVNIRQHIPIGFLCSSLFPAQLIAEIDQIGATEFVFRTEKNRLLGP
jgi:hypothetical protein